MAYRQYVRYLKWLTLALFAYVGAVLSVDVPWGEVVAAITLPRMDLSAGCGDAGRRDFRHDDQPLSVFLAGGAGSRGG